MPRRPLHVTGAPEGPLLTALAALRDKLHVPAGFPPDVLAAADEAAAHPVLPAEDATDIPFFTIDPPGSLDLDQAMHLSRQGTGYRVRYAIADVAAFVVPDGPLDREAHHRAVTLYFPDLRIPLHPPVLSEGAASLLPGQTRPAAVWTIDLDASGGTLAVDVRRALIRSKQRLDYDSVQKKIDDGTAEEPLLLLKTIGLLREQVEIARGGISLRVPDQEIVEHDHTYELTYRAPLAADGWNAQLSLLTGMAAAELMLAHGTGVLRTQVPKPGKLEELHHTADALHIDWPPHMSYAERVRTLDPSVPREAAFLQACTGLMRRADYTVFRDGHLPPNPVHASVAAPYAHCTAPLRRLVDRYATEICLAAVAGREPPEWVLAALDAVPARMKEGGERAGDIDGKCVDLVEAAVLKDRVGEIFEGVVVKQGNPPGTGTVQLESPAVVGPVTGITETDVGRRLQVRLTRADMEVPTVSFALA
ncbi:MULTISPECIES: RNB domain-containing ribonuclease [Streptomyces]|uniref:Ribonuclease II n=2 Tax=Streptomyces TaxID=1883 RepID=A0A2U9P0B3_STRAS|nr:MULTISPECIES: RNB domain-containing ribonuclease [Streptomyces]AWT42962.1 ribonuclease II [Streptomyces actuosus]MBM4824909.1 RNB domain-containing ribonuclease [Streptomyces actuosus]GHF71404.1 ribonuclease R [Streptomyces griseosporeus]